MFETRTARAIWVRIVCAVALVCIGLAHKPPLSPPASVSSLELAHYAFPDGTLPVLCLAGDEDGKGGGLSGPCAACRLTADVVLAAPGEAGEWMAPPVAHHVPRLRFAAVKRQLLPPNASPRAPPSGQNA